MAEDIIIDGFRPARLLRPGTPAELGDIVRAARDQRTALYPVGGATMLDLGLVPNRPGDAVSTTALNRVIDYPARDMTITVQAGMTVAELDRVLAGENQQLPVDVPLSSRATLGGAMAVNASGPRRFGYGTLRDYVIGISAVNDQGEEWKAGGRVVKNVAGYDMMKLLIGSLGTLGIITQVTLKVKPRTEDRRLFRVPLPCSAVAGVLESLRSTKTRPVIQTVSASFTGAGNFDATEAVLSIGFDDNAESVAWQSNQLAEEFRGSGRPAPSAVDPRSVIEESTDFPLTGPQNLRLKIQAVPSATWTIVESVARSGPCAVTAHAGNGVVIVRFDAADPADAKRRIDVAQSVAGVHHGSVVITRCPADWKSTLPVWGNPRGDIGVMRAIKSKLDPHGLFNPGRFVGGI